MLDPKCQLVQYKDELVEFLHPSYVQMCRAKIVSPMDVGMQYFSESVVPKGKSVDYISMDLYGRGSAYTRRVRELILNPGPGGPLEFVHVGNSSQVPNAIERVQQLRPRRHYDILVLLERGIAELSIGITGHGLLEDCQDRWSEVLNSVKTVGVYQNKEALEYAITAAGDHTFSLRADAVHDERDGEVAKLVRKLPKKLAFLAFSIMEVAAQDCSHAEDVNINAMESVVRKRVSELSPKKQQEFLTDLFNSYDSWFVQQDRNSTACVPFAVVHGVLFGMASYGLDL